LNYEGKYLSRQRNITLPRHSATHSQSKTQYPRGVEELTSFIARGDNTNPRSASEIYNDKYVSLTAYSIGQKSGIIKIWGNTLQ